MKNSVSASRSCRGKADALSLADIGELVRKIRFEGWQVPPRRPMQTTHRSTGGNNLGGKLISGGKYEKKKIFPPVCFTPARSEGLAH